MSRPPEEGSWVLEDRAITDLENDAFDHEDVAKQLADIIRNLKNATTIGLIGGFGTGKSSIGNLLQSELKGHDALHVVRFSAEKHSGIARQRAMVYSLANALQEDRQATKRAVDEALSRLSGSEDKVHLSWSEIPFLQLVREPDHLKALLRAVRASALVAFGIYMILVLGAWAFGVTTNPWVWPFGPTNWLFNIAMLPVLGIAATTWTKAALNVPTITRRQPRAEAADEIERVFIDLVRLPEKQLVIIVDDIDRLPPDEVLQAIAAVKTFQQVPRERPPYFVIACDDKIVEEAIVDATPGIAQVDNDDWRAAAEYLNKFFVVRQVLPPHMPGDMADYALRILAERKHPARGVMSDRLDGVIGTLIHEHVADPRHVLRLLNAYFTDYRLARYRESKEGGRLQADEVTGNPELLARLTVLKVDYYNVYEAIAEEFELLTAIDAHVTGATLTPSQQELLEDFISVAPSDDDAGPDGAVDNEDVGDYRSVASDRSPGTVERTSVPTIQRSRHQAIEYLRSTAGYVETPPTLTPFIFLGVPATDRTIGSARAEAVRRALQTRNIPDLRERLEAADGDLREDLVAVMDRLIGESRREPQRSNVIHTAAGVLDLVIDPTRIADRIAVAVSAAPSSAPTPDLLRLVVDHAQARHRDQLVNLLTSFVGDSDHAARSARARAVLAYGQTAPKAPGPRSALADFFSGLPEHASWEEARTWIAAAGAIDKTTRSQLLGESFYAATVELATGADKVSNGDIEVFRRLIRDASQDALGDSVRIATQRCLKAEQAASRRIAAELLHERDYTSIETSDFALLLAYSVTDGPLESDETQMALVMPLLESGAPAYAKTTFTVDEEKRRVVSPVALAIVHGLASEQSTTARAAGDAARALAENAPDATKYLVEGSIELSNEWPDPDSHRGTGARSLLIDLLDTVPDELAEQAAEHLTDPIEAGADAQAPNVASALDALPRVLRTDHGHGISAQLLTEWRQGFATTNPGSQSTEALLRAIAIAFEEVPDIARDEAQAIRTRLWALASSGQPGIEAVGRDWLIDLPWVTEHQEVGEHYAEMFDDLDLEQRGRLATAVASWSSAAQADLPEGLISAMARHTASEDATAQEWAAVAGLWRLMDITSKGGLVAAGVTHQPFIVERLREFDQEEIHAVLNHLSGDDGFVHVVEALADNPYASDAAATYIATAQAAGRAWHPGEVDAVVSHLLSEQDAATLVAIAGTMLSEGQGQADKALDLLSSLARAHAGIAELRDHAPALAALLPATTIEMAERIGAIAGLANIDDAPGPLTAALKGMKSRKAEEGQRALAEAYSRGREQAARP